MVVTIAAVTEILYCHHFLLVRLTMSSIYNITKNCHQNQYSQGNLFLHTPEDVNIRGVEKEASSFSVKFVIQEQS